MLCFETKNKLKKPTNDFFIIFVQISAGVTNTQILILKKMLQQSNFNPIVIKNSSTTKAGKNRFKLAIKKLLAQKKDSVRRKTLISWHGEACKKNLAYYDQEIYALLKRRKDVKVKIIFYFCIYHFNTVVY